MLDGGVWEIVRVVAVAAAAGSSTWYGLKWRMNGLEDRMVERFDGVERRFDDVDQRAARIEGKVDAVNGRVRQHDVEIAVLRQRFDDHGAVGG